MVLREIDNQTMNITNEIIQVASHTEMWDQGEIISPQIKMVSLWLIWGFRPWLRGVALLFMECTVYKSSSETFLSVLCRE
jgi:hypothetical protein